MSSSSAEATPSLRGMIRLCLIVERTSNSEPSSRKGEQEEEAGAGAESAVVEEEEEEEEEEEGEEEEEEEDEEREEEEEEEEHDLFCTVQDMGLKQAVMLRCRPRVVLTRPEGFLPERCQPVSLM